MGFLREAESQKLGPEFLGKCLPQCPSVLGREEVVHPRTEKDGSSVVKMSWQGLKICHQEGALSLRAWGLLLEASRLASISWKD